MAMSTPDLTKVLRGLEEHADVIDSQTGKPYTAAECPNCGEPLAVSNLANGAGPVVTSRRTKKKKPSSY